MVDVCQVDIRLFYMSTIILLFFYGMRRGNIELYIKVHMICTKKYVVKSNLSYSIKTMKIATKTLSIESA